MIRTQLLRKSSVTGRGILTNEIVSSPKLRTSQHEIRALKLCCATKPHSPTECPSTWAVSQCRRYLDCTIASLVIVFSLPISIGLSVLVYLSSRGPILFRQKRIGRYGQEFTLYKFRSMRVDGGSDSGITIRGNPRITRVGSFMRRLKLDELPQFWNVVRGDMSLVGPRPKLANHEALFMLVRPGITGPATLAFRREEDLLGGIPPNEIEEFYETFIKPVKARIDSTYIRSATLRSDIALWWATMVSCLGISTNYLTISTQGDLGYCESGAVGPNVKYREHK